MSAQSLPAAPTAAASVSTLLLLLVAVLGLVAGDGDSDVPEYDVCVLGGGAGGMISAVWLKERGYSVLVLEQAAQLGGHCSTVPFSDPQTDPATFPFWIEPGVQIFPNIKKLKEYEAINATFGLRIGPWNIDTADIIDKYGLRLPGFPGASIPFPPGTSLGDLPRGTPYYFDLSRPQSATNPLIAPLGSPPATAPPSAGPPPAFLTLIEQIKKYPWLDSGDTPDRIPPELLRPFSEFIAANGLESIVPTIIDPLFGGSLGNYNKLTALYALRNLSPTILLLGVLPNAFLFPLGGCSAMYGGFARAVGSNNIKLNAYTTWSRRPSSGRNSRILLGGQIRNPNSSPVSYAYECGKVIVAFPQLPAAMRFLNPDNRERKVFDQVQRRYYYGSLVKLTKDGNRPAPFLLQVPQPSSSGAVLVSQGNLGPKAPANVWLASDVDQPFTTAQMNAQLQTNMDNLKSTNLISSYDILPPGVYDHVYQPHPTLSALTDRFFSKLEKLQGYRNTYYVGALNSFAAHHCVWEKAFRIINNHFPPKYDDDDDDDSEDDDDSGSGNNAANVVADGGSSNALAVGGLVAACALAVGLLALAAVVLRRRKLRHTAAVDLASMPAQSAVDVDGNRLSLAEIAARHA